MTVTRETSPVVRYVVDYDIPISSASRRRAFYREVQRLRKKLQLHGRMSSQSVLITTDRELAYEVYKIASQYGRANLYSAILLSDGESRHR